MPLQSIKAPLKLANSLADRYTTEDRLKHCIDPTVPLSDRWPSEQTIQVISAAAQSRRPPQWTAEPTHMGHIGSLLCPVHLHGQVGVLKIVDSGEPMDGDAGVPAQPLLL
jgi:hypothetical protein